MVGGGQNRKISMQGLSISININFEAEWLAGDNTLENFTGHISWCRRCMKQKGLVIKTKLEIAQRVTDGFKMKICDFHKYIR